MSERESLIFASLLHDIGKLAQRGGETLKGEYEKGKYLESTYCPSYKSYFYTHHHLLYSAQFIKEIFKDKAEIIESLVLSHHKPDVFSRDIRLSLIIQLADWLSSGERKKEEEIEEEKDIEKEPLISIFSQIEIDKVKTEEKYCKPVKIEKSLENFIPIEEKQDAITNEANFKKLWNEFKEEAKKFLFHLISKRVSINFYFFLKNILYLFLQQFIKQNQKFLFSTT